MEDNKYMDKLREEQATLKTAYNIVEEEIKKYNDIASKYESEWRELEKWRGDYEKYIDYLEAVNRYSKADFEAQKMKQWLKSLYFGRIDFRHEGEAKDSTYYIAKLPHWCFSARDRCQEAGITIIDWRAPIASLFYSRGDSYDANDEEQEGELMLARHIEVKEDRVLSINDLFDKRNGRALEEQENIAGLDRVLKRQLERYGRDRLNDIVQTIQADQNRLIRYPFDKHLIIQGGAGTGKTVVLLHRVAYCMYITQCKPEDILILTPNRLLLEQISGILPDLHIYNVPQLSLEEFFWQVVERSNSKKLSRSIHLKPVSILCLEDSKIQSARSNSKLIAEIKHVLDEIVNDALDKHVYSLISDLKYNEQTIIPALTIKQFFKHEYIRKQPYERQMAIFLLRLRNRLRAHFGEDKVLDEDEKKKISQIVESYLKSFPSASRLMRYLAKKYLDCVSDLNMLINTETKEAKNGTLLSIDDMGALLYLYIKLHDRTDKKYKFIFIDEAHNLSPIWLVLLKEFLAPGGTFTLAGDIYQISTSVHGNLLPDVNWNWLKKVLEPNVAVESLTVSYRATQSIVEAAKQVITKSFPEAGELIKGVRPSDKSVFQMSRLQEFVDFVRSDSKKIRTVAVITPTKGRAESVRKELASQLQALSIQKEFVILSVEETGGLEFDAVLVDQFNFYNCKNPIHTRALYTAISRATHYLCIGI